MKIRIFKDVFLFTDVILNLKEHHVFLNKENPISEEGINFYLNKKEFDFPIEIVTATYSEKIENQIIQIGTKPKNGDKIYIVNDGHHRVSALMKQNINKFKATIVGYKT